MGDAPPLRLRRTGLAVEDRQALAKALALLGESRLSSNLNQLAHMASIGALPVTPERFCRSHDELRNFLRLRTRHRQHVPADRRRLLHLRRAAIALALLEAA
ncbi:hypothetical protein [Siccirubricoccus sp. G192]|uniref:hypothetical protein n=1 Tax=Siccirubricoccus sp. G192 TaxID=2849651 RepID=UPI001C2CB5AF|nr:hypothetical protein [Siccirubricoccus sp. G192]MBV1800154.1 hypothetical protein [Siccirubricoccus sp. G192]